MKKIIVLLLVCTCLSACTSTKDKGNFKDEMKIAYPGDLSKEDGADSVERQEDHKDSLYFNQLDFYNMKSSDSLTLISKFKTMQQTSEWSCGVTSSLMVLNHYNKLGNHNEESLAKFRENGLKEEATTLKGAINIFKQIGGFTIESTYDYGEDEKYEKITLDMIRDYLKKDIPVMVAWNDFGGHWQVIIGYDDMGTETTQDDVIIVADPYDTTDHNQDGYGVYSAERFYYNWTMYDFFEDAFDIKERDLLFLAASPTK
ncbi:MAG: C39 family peptidase [Coprobacillus sp.]